MSLVEQLEGRKTALTVRAVAEFLSVSDDTVYRMAGESELPYLRARGSLRFDPGDVAAWLNRQRPQPAAARGRR